MNSKLLSDILSEKQVYYILNEFLLSDCQVVSYDISPACEGLSGFLGDHYRIKLYVGGGRVRKEIHIFVKLLPQSNKPKAEFITKYKYNLRESLMFKYIAESGAAEGENPWCAKAYIYNENVLVMPDLTVEGYRLQPIHEYLDLDHVLVTVRALARFHATLTNMFTRKFQNEQQRETLLLDLQNTRIDPTFRDSPWLRAAAKLAATFLREFSSHEKYPKNLEEHIFRTFVEGCGDIGEHPGTLNVLVHKDLWVNNIMFKYQDDVPVNAIIIDYQCIRYAPPAFDLMIFMYLTTSRSFREEHESKILNYYFSVFTENLDNAAKARLEDLSYDLDSFLALSEMARKFGMVETIGIFPYVLMDPKRAEITFDDPKTYTQYLEQDRSQPVLAHARRCDYYKDRQLEVMEEFAERYILNDVFCLRD